MENGRSAAIAGDEAGLAHAPFRTETCYAHVAPRLDNIQVLRGLAALGVVMTHLALEIERHWEFLSVRLATLFDAGQAGVDLFFVISGFVMLYVSYDRFGSRGEAKRFLRKRIARVVPAYWFYTTLLLLTLFLSPSILRNSSVSLPYIAASYLFIPWPNPGTGLVSPVLELGWTLNYEMYFYALFALSLLLPLRAGLLMLSVWFVGSVMAGSVTALLPVLRYMTSPMVLEFIAGVAIALLFIQGVIVGTRGRLVLGCLALIWFVAFYAIEPDSRRIIGCGIPAVLLVATMTLAHEQKSRGRTRLKGLLVDLGDCGYSLYLCHMFVIRGATTLLGAFVRGPLSLVFYSLICISATVALARISYRYLEIPLKQALEPCTAAARRPRA